MSIEVIVKGLGTMSYLPTCSALDRYLPLVIFFHLCCIIVLIMTFLHLSLKSQQVYLFSECKISVGQASNEEAFLC